MDPPKARPRKSEAAAEPTRTGTRCSDSGGNLTSMVQDLEAGPTTSVTAFGDRLAEAVERKRSQLIVGLDPLPELLPVELAGDAGLGRSEAAKATERFCCGVIDAVAAYAVGVKPQIAFFEALGPPGMQ